jgi:hypothetical protein
MGCACQVCNTVRVGLPPDSGHRMLTVPGAPGHKALTSARRYLMVEDKRMVQNPV